MATKVRKQVYIEPHQEAILKRLAKEQGITEAEIIRRAIDQHTRVLRIPRRDLAAWEQERAFILGLIAQGPVPGKRVWRREELHER
ncbi:MAG: ribbon-helix-helix domain-containing protein [Anaerolineae bacterium]